MNVPTPVIDAAHERVAAAGQLAGVGEPLGERHADRRRRSRSRAPAMKASCGVVRVERDREDRGERRERAVDQADHRRLHALQEEAVLVGHE